MSMQIMKRDGSSGLQLCIKVTLDLCLSMYSNNLRGDRKMLLLPRFVPFFVTCF